MSLNTTIAPLRLVDGRCAYAYRRSKVRCRSFAGELRQTKRPLLSLAGERLGVGQPFVHWGGFENAFRYHGASLTHP